MATNYSVTIPLYYKENPLFLDECILSLLNQTIISDDIIIVADGPLTKELDEVVDRYVKQYEFIKVIRLNENHGTGYASQIGLDATKNDIVARMDSDDIAYPNRFELELTKINEGYDFVGGAITEFEREPSNIIATKIVPSDKDEIIKYSKKRNPFCNVTTMFRKDVVIAIGGYANQPFLEDYTLGIKIIQNGYKFTNISEPLVNVRCDSSQIKRRGNKRVRRYLKELRKYMVKTNYISKKEYFIYNLESDIFCLSPSWIKKILYKKVLRK